MSEPKKHHYIPVFYLAAWANDRGNLCEFSRPYRVVTHKWRNPSATAYEEHLYTIPGVPAEEAQEIEKHFMGLVDSTAAQVHQKFLADGKDDLTAVERLAWSRFLYAMMIRNPEQIASLQSRYRAAAPGFVEEFREDYYRLRGPQHPEAFDDFKSRFLANPFNTSVAHLLVRLLNSDTVIPEIQSFRSWTCRLGQFANPTFLTSDRPIIVTNGLRQEDAHIVLPLSPRVLFIAARNDQLYRQIRKMPNTQVAKLANEKVTRQSHRYVYGADASQQGFVAKRLGNKEPSTPVG